MKMTNLTDKGYKLRNLNITSISYVTQMKQKQIVKGLKIIRLLKFILKLFKTIITEKK
jgi:hypothetical protein